ncbi:uncharacterized protein [Panulirus ornatus]|uniref:uncharacterized protein n=1 Tax=Panulirus ornatus TaxID=150431 RepID=UPI003A869DB4
MLKSVILSVLVVRWVWSVTIQYPRESRLLYTKTIATSIISSAPPGARLISTRGDLPPLIERLIQNATDIRQNIVDTFHCKGRVYGYYADQDNKCQIFHICVPMQQLFPDLYDSQDIYQFSFICPAHTIFTQDAMVCAWKDSAFPCSMAHQLYDRNNHFFIVSAEAVQKTSASDTVPTSAPSVQMTSASTIMPTAASSIHKTSPVSATMPTSTSPVQKSTHLSTTISDSASPLPSSTALPVLLMTTLQPKRQPTETPTPTVLP